MDELVNQYAKSAGIDPRMMANFQSEATQYLYTFTRPSRREYDFSEINLFVVGCVALGLSLLISLLLTVHRNPKRFQKDRAMPLHASETKTNKRAMERIQNNAGDYNPPWWYSPDLGTLSAFGHDPKLKYETEIIERIEDGLPVSYSIDWWPCKPPPSSSSSSSMRIIVFVPGLGLTARNKFCQKFAQYVHDNGQFTVAVVSARGLDVPLKSKSLWHPALDGDAKHAVLGINSLYPQATLFAVGYSAGSNIVQRLVSNPLLQTIIKGSMIVCYNKDYLAGRQHLEGSIKGLGYSMAMCSLQKRILQLNMHIHSDLGHSFVKTLIGCRFLSEYDQFAHLAYGYDSPSEYYSALSGVPSSSICIPTLIIQPLDDPLHSGQVKEHIDIAALVSNPLVMYLQPEYGNHFGFYEGPLMGAFSNTTSYTYPAKLAKEYFDVLCQDDVKGM